MAIYKPELLLSRNDREALVLLGQLALASQDELGGNNVGDVVALSPVEAVRLLQLLEDFVSSRLFLEGSYFAEEIGNGDADSNERLKGIYLSWRSRRGFTTVLAGQRWRELVFRAGFNSSEDAWIWPHALQRSPLRPMKLDHFLGMERKLAAVSGLHPRVQKLLLTFVESRLPNIKALRDRKAKILPGEVRSCVERFISDLSDHSIGRERAPMKQSRVVAIATIVMDTAALFSTRDWTIAGVISSLAAVAPEAMGYPSTD